MNLSQNPKILPADVLIEEERVPGYRPEFFYPAAPGQVLNDRYKILTKIGWGTASTVWLAEDLKRIPFQYVTLKIATSNPDYDDMVLHELNINKYLTKDPSLAGFAFVRASFDDFIAIGPTKSAHLCLVFEAMREPLSQFQHRLVGDRIPAQLLKVYVDFIAVLLWMRRTKKFLFKPGPAELDGSHTGTSTDETKPSDGYDINSPELDGVAKVAPAEAMDTPLTEMEDGSAPLAGYFAPKGAAIAEMSDTTPAAQELSSPGSEIYEMFDASVYREMPSAEGSSYDSLSRSPSAKNQGGLARRFSWVRTPLSAVAGPVLPAYEETSLQHTGSNDHSATAVAYATDKKEPIPEEGEQLQEQSPAPMPAPRPAAPVPDPEALERELRAVVEEDTLGPMQYVSPSTAISHRNSIPISPAVEERTISPPSEATVSPPNATPPPLGENTAQGGTGTISPYSAVSPPQATAEPVSAETPLPVSPVGIGREEDIIISPPTATAVHQHIPLVLPGDKSDDEGRKEDIPKEER